MNQQQEMSSTVMDRLFLELSNVVSPDTKTARELALENHIAELKAELRIWRGDLAKVEVELSSIRKTTLTECVTIAEKFAQDAADNPDPSNLDIQYGRIDAGESIAKAIRALAVHSSRKQD